MDFDGSPRRPMRRELDRAGRVALRYRDRLPGLNAILAAAVQHRPDGEALVADHRRWTWLELERDVAALAGALVAEGIWPSDRVALVMENSHAFVLIAFAVARIGAVLVPISAREQAPGVDHALLDSGAVMLFYQRTLERVVPTALGAGPVRRCICVDDEAFDRMFDAASSHAVEEDEDAVAAILYTSGTTGRAKGVTLRHGAIVHSAMSLADAMELGPRDRSIVAVPLSHVTGYVALLATMAFAQGALILQSAFSAETFLEAAEREGMTHTVMVPAMYNLCVLNGSFEHRDLSRWRVAGFGGAPMAPHTIERLRERAPALALMNLYGATETTSPAVIMPARMADEHREAVGLAAPGCEIVVMDEAGREVDRGGTGEFWIRGAMVTHGYWAHRGGADDFVDGYWRSGDLGFIDPDGFVHLRGRARETINRGGYKVYPAEVENALLSLDGVKEAAIVARACPVLGQRVHAVVVVDERRRTDDHEPYRAGIVSRLSDYKIPETWDLTHQPLPRNANGKVHKRLIEEALEPYRRSTPV